MYLAQNKNMDDSGFSEDTDRLPELSNLHVLLSEVWEMMIGTCEPYNLGGFATAGIRACYYRSVVVLFYKTSKRTIQINFNSSLVKKVTSNLPSITERCLVILQKFKWRINSFTTSRCFINSYSS
jgi:hypothetical protein